MSISALRSTSWLATALILTLENRGRDVLVVGGTGGEPPSLDELQTGLRAPRSSVVTLTVSAEPDLIMPTLIPPPGPPKQGRRKKRDRDWQR